MARRRLEGLERVLGVNALFSTAYGNVGSSIYYALGLVAALALGLTPIVFLITGIFFLVTEPHNKFVRFHAYQSVILFGALSIAWFVFMAIPPIGWFLDFIVLPPLSAFLWLLLMFKAYQGEKFKIPVTGDMAEQRVQT